MLSLSSLQSRTFKSHNTQRSPLSSLGRYSGRSYSYRLWDELSMQKAAVAVDDGMSLRKAAEIFLVPKSTLYDRVTGKVKFGARSGPDPYLTNEEEEELLNFLLKCSDIGYSHSRKQIISIVQQVVDGKGIQTVVSNGWWERFCQRHPQVTLRAPAPLSYSRAVSSDRESLNNYFDLLEETLHANNIFNKATNIFNVDESGFPLSPKSLKVFSHKGAKNPSYLTSDCKSQVTVLVCTSAAGYALPPFVIFDRKTLNPELTTGEVPGSIYGLSSKGWIDMELFNEWFFRHFLLYAPPSRPLLLLMDGHSSHYCPEVIREAAAQKVVIFVLPPNTTHCTQPLDKGTFSALKVAWRQKCHDFICSNPGKSVSRYDFSKLFSSAWYEAMTMANITSGFKVTGVCPFDRNAFKLPGETFTSFRPQTLQEETGLAYIPMYSPRRLTTKPFMQVSPDRPVQNSTCGLPLLKPVSSISKYLNTPMAPSAIIKKDGKKISGRVLTSCENIQLITAKEQMKIEKEKIKEERQKQKEEKRKIKERAAILKAELKIRGATASKMQIFTTDSENGQESKQGVFNDENIEITSLFKEEMSDTTYTEKLMSSTGLRTRGRISKNVDEGMAINNDCIEPMMKTRGRSKKMDEGIVINDDCIEPMKKTRGRSKKMDEGIIINDDWIEPMMKTRGISKKMDEGMVINDDCIEPMMKTRGRSKKMDEGIIINDDCIEPMMKTRGISKKMDGN